jgi:hypothetical protein
MVTLQKGEEWECEREEGEGEEVKRSALFRRFEALPITP